MQFYLPFKDSCVHIHWNELKDKWGSFQKAAASACGNATQIEHTLYNFKYKYFSNGYTD